MKPVYTILSRLVILFLPLFFFCCSGDTEDDKINGIDEAKVIADLNGEVIYILDNNTSLLESMAHADHVVQAFLNEMSNEILTHSSLNEIVECHLNPFEANERGKFIIEILKQIEDLGTNLP